LYVNTGAIAKPTSFMAGAVAQYLQFILLN